MLLRLFSRFRALEGECQNLRESLQSLTTEKLLLQDRLDATLNDRAELWSLMKTALDNERAAYQSHVNLQWQRQGLAAPYPDAPQMPEGNVPTPNRQPIARRELPSEAIARETRKFFSAYAESLQK